MIWALSNQAGRCAYCDLEISLDVRRHETVDHFLPKEVFPRWTYEPANLLLACQSCNSILKSRDQPAIVPQDCDLDTVLYLDLEFRICHPYFDTVLDHIEGGFRANGLPPGLVRAKSPRGETTIDLLSLNSPGLLWTWMGQAEAQLRKVQAVATSRLLLAQLTIEVATHRRTPQVAP